MKFILITVMGIFTALFTKGQTNTDGEKTIVQIAALYNKEAYHDLYLMLSPEFKSWITEDKMTAFYKKNIRQPLGNIISWQPAANKAGAKNYTVQFDNGKLDLTFYTNDSSQITTMQWLPHKDTIAIKKRDVSTIAFDNPKQTKLQLLIDSIALDYLEDSVNCGLGIAIVNGGKNEMFFYGSNYKDDNVLPGMRTLYEIGSVTKTFTGILLAHAINEGKIKPDDDIRQYLPGTYHNLQYKGVPITIKELGNHTSGLPRLPADLAKQPGYDKNDPYKNYSKEMMYAYLKKVKTDTFPGTVNEYSNFGVALLGIILENVYQQPLEDLIRLYVTEPAKMKYTKFILNDAEKDKMATGFNENGTEAANWNLGAFIAAGGLKSNLQDMLDYLTANMNEINADFKLAHQQTYKDANIAVGLNWILTPIKDGQTLIWHNGGTAGFSSYCGYIKEKKVGVVVLSNSAVNVDNVALNILKGMGQ